jgi:hypothetical protein
MTPINSAASTVFWDNPTAPAFLLILKLRNIITIQLRRISAVKAVGIDAALRVTKLKSSRESESVGPKRQPVDQIGRRFDDHRLPRLPRQREAELAGVEAEAESRSRAANRECRESFADRIVPPVRHIEIARAVHRHVTTVKFRRKSRKISRRLLLLENLALRHQLTVLRRQTRKPKLRQADRLLWLTLRRLWPDWQKGLLLFQPQTVIAWHRLGFRLFWSWKSRVRGGRPTADRKLIELIRRMWSSNPTWGSLQRPSFHFAWPCEKHSAIQLHPDAADGPDAQDGRTTLKLVFSFPVDEPANGV